MVEVAINITNRCDKICTHCSTNSVPQGRSMPFYLLRKILENIRHDKNVSKYIGITGGEPLLYQWKRYDFRHVFHLMKSLGITPTIMVGGVFDTPHYRDIIKEIKGAYITISFNLYRSNWKESFENAYKLLSKENKIATIFIRYIEGYDKKETLYEFEKMKRKFPLLKNIEVFTGVVTSVGRGTRLLNAMGRGYERKDCSIYADQFFLSVEPNGNVLPCCGTLNKRFFYQKGWPKIKATEDLNKIGIKAELFCLNCPYRKHDKIS